LGEPKKSKSTEKARKKLSKLEEEKLRREAVVTLMRKTRKTKMNLEKALRLLLLGKHQMFTGTT
jgi:hypothetical protein